MPVKFQFNIGDIAPMLIAYRESSFLAARRNRYMTIAYAEMVSWVWLLVMYLFRLAAKKDDAL